MCTSYKAGRDIDFHALFGAAPPAGQWREEVYKDYPAPIVLGSETGVRRCCLATFGIVPRKHIPEGVKVFDTMNCRAESAATKRSFSSAWRKGQTCLIPCNHFYEPNYESGKPVRWRIGLATGQPFALAGLWREWNEPDGPSISFTMLTLNADNHTLMRRFHKPGREKRSVVVISEAHYDDWLACRNPEVTRTFLGLMPPDSMTGEPAPLPPRGGSQAPLLT